METRSNPLTGGSLLSGIRTLAWPMFAAALLQNAQSLIDLFWVGRLGSTSVAALAMSGTVLMTLFPVVMGLCVGTVAFVSRNVGGGRLGDASEAAGQSLLLALALGVLTGLPGWLAAGKLCLLLGASPEVLEKGVAYLRVSFLGSFSVFLLFTGNSVLQGAGNTRVPMCVMGLANVLNLLLDPIFIYGLLGFPRLEVRGAALATVLSQIIAAGLVLRLLARGAAGLRVSPAHWRWNAELAGRILRIGLPGSGQMLSRSLMSLLLMRIVAGCGMPALTAYGIGLRFHTIILLPIFAIGNAAATMVGQNLGAAQPQRALRAAWIATAMALALTAATAAGLWGLAPHLMRIFDQTAEVVATGAAYLRVVSPFYVFAALGIVLSRAQMGAGDTLAPMICTILSLWGLQVPLAVVLSRLVHPPTLGIWWAMAAALFFNGLLVTAWWQTGRWQRARL
jgi:putative MATE family efflux protein